MVLPISSSVSKMDEEGKSVPLKPQVKSDFPETSHDPVLQRLARTDTFDSDWPTLRHHLQLALLSTPPIFQARKPPAAYQFPPDTPARPSNPTPTSPTPSPLSSKLPSSPFASTSSVPPASSLLLSRSPSSSSSPLSASAQEEQPSTLGGLVIAPFPPLDPERRNRRRLSAGSIGPVPPAVVARMNGHQGGAAAQASALARGNVFEDEWDEAVVIGGKKLPGWMEDEEGKKEVERVGKLIDELEEPPFTIQRLAELLLSPTKHHSNLGKFLRALEKNLLVTTPWTAPSYVAAPPATFSGSRGLFGPTSSPSSASSASSPDSSSTMPVGSTTPMFSPIPFLVRPTMDTESAMDIDADGDEGSSGKREELMSPLVLNDKELEAEPVRRQAEKPSAEQGSSTQSASASAGRSQTPEPEDISSRPQTQSQPSQPPASLTPNSLPLPEQVLTGSESSDPAHQPYLGRVDELDTGPITRPSTDSGSNSSASSGSSGGSHGPSVGGKEEGSGMGTGEGGNMTPHGMSDKPVPISSTTTVAEDGERRVAGLPRTKSIIGLAERIVAQIAAGGKKPGVVEEKSEEGKGEVKKAKVEEEASKGEEAKKDEEVEKGAEAKREDGMEVDAAVEAKSEEAGKAEEKAEGQ